MSTSAKRLSSPNAPAIAFIHFNPYFRAFSFWHDLR